jgi:hypothetical protein
MKFYSISVNFFTQGTKHKLYDRHYTILAEDEAHARAVIINHLTMLDFYNFEITGVQEVGDIGN